jgi:hypothetical protein
MTVAEAVALAIKYARAIADGKIEARVLSAMSVEEALAFGDSLEAESTELQEKLEDIVERNTAPAWAQPKGE